MIDVEHIVFSHYIKVVVILNLKGGKTTFDSTYQTPPSIIFIRKCTICSIYHHVFII